MTDRRPEIEYEHRLQVQLGPENTVSLSTVCSCNEPIRRTRLEDQYFMTMTDLINVLHDHVRQHRYDS